MIRAVARAARWLGRFLWDFIVGDTPELALATGVIVAFAFLLAGSEWLGAILLPLLAAGFLLASTLRGRKRAPSRSTRP
ncbi:MAG TPA: hypothetical protein VHY81_12205 [Acidimicrobiales bacterium]|nr:hypothetical protein [Acidimicrobiales bacterium]